MIEKIEKWLKDQAENHILERGNRIYQEQQVRPRRTETGFQARIFGTAEYEVAININGNKISASCNCPYEQLCKHITAVGFAVIRGQIEERDLDINQGIVDLNASQDLEAFIKVFNDIPEDRKLNFLKNILAENQSLRMRFLQHIRGSS